MSIRISVLKILCNIYVDNFIQSSLLLYGAPTILMLCFQDRHSSSLSFSICDLMVFSHEITFCSMVSQNMCFMFEFGEVFLKVEDCFIELLFEFRNLHNYILFYVFHRDRKIAK